MCCSWKEREVAGQNVLEGGVEGPGETSLLSSTHLGVSSPSLSSKHSATSSGVSTLSWSCSREDSEELDRWLEAGLGPKSEDA